MTTNSCKVEVDTEGQFVTVESVTVGVEGSNFTGFTAGEKYNISILNTADLKVADFEFPCEDIRIPFLYEATTDDLYIRTQYGPCTISILECPSSSS